MARIRYRVYPNDPEATEKSKMTAMLMSFLSLGIIFATFAYLICAFIFGKSGDYDEMLTAVAWLFVLLLGIVWLAIKDIKDRHTKIKIIRTYIILFLCSILCVTAWIVTIVQFSTLIKINPLALFGVLAIDLILSFVVYVVYQVMVRGSKIYSKTQDASEAENVIPSSPVSKSVENNTYLAKTIDVNNSNMPNDNLHQVEYIYCRKCGNRMIGDSNYCSKCGEKIW